MTYIIAEAGTGHMGSPQRALDFALEALNAGANAVKYQMFVPDEPLFCPMPGDEKRMERWARSALTLEQWRKLVSWVPAGLDVLWSAFQPTCIEWLKQLKPLYVKVASRARTSFPLWYGPEFLISAPPGTQSVLHPRQHYLRCVPEYPAPLEKSAFELPFDGLSDHSGTIWPGMDAIFNRARFLEVHFKISGADMGNDDPVCLTVDQLEMLCDARDAFARMHPDRV